MDFIKIKLLSDKAKLPSRSNPDDAGLDLYAAEKVKLRSRFSGILSGLFNNLLGLFGLSIKDPSRAVISLDIAVEFPIGYVLQIHDRSGLSSRDGLHRVAGIVDASFRGTMKVALINLSNKSYTVNVGDKIAQAILMPIALPIPNQVTELSDSARGEKGWGSTGK